MGGAKEDDVEGGVSVSFDIAWGGKDFSVNDHVGDGADQSV
jgi:hypothetical protein